MNKGDAAEACPLVFFDVARPLFSGFWRRVLVVECGPPEMVIVIFKKLLQIIIW